MNCSRMTALAAVAAVSLLGGASTADAAAQSDSARTEVAACVQRLGDLGAAPSVSYGDAFMRSLNRGNLFAAGCYAVYPVVRLAVAENAVGAGWRRTTADSGMGYTYSTYQAADGRVALLAVKLGDRGPGGMHAVESVTLQQDSGSVTSYADALMRGWADGDKDAMAAHAAYPAWNTLWMSRHPAQGWGRTVTRYEVGGTTIEYSLAGTRWVLTLHINQADAIAGSGQAVKSATFWRA